VPPPGAVDIDIASVRIRRELNAAIEEEAIVDEDEE
jgi:hypothetical protein